MSNTTSTIDPEPPEPPLPSEAPPITPPSPLPPPPLPPDPPASAPLPEPESQPQEQAEATDSSPVNPPPSAPPDTSSPPPDPTPTTTTQQPPPPPPPTSSPNPPPPPTSSPPNPDTTTTISNSDPGTTSTIVTTVTTTPHTGNPGGPATSATSSTATPIGPGSGSSGGLSTPGKIAVAVVVPIAAVALFVLAAIWFWRRRRARKDAEEARRKEVEDYAYNPNQDPTIPAVGMIPDPRYDMREDTSSGYRGWGSTTLAGSTGRKASTTMSGGVAGEPLMDGARSGSYSPEGEILGAMGPSAANNRGADVHRGPSNASSSYSAAGRSDGSGDGGIGMAYGGGNPYYEQYGSGNPYAEPGPGNQRPQELPGQPIIRDNPARRNTRIENPSHYPQQSAGISQNF